MPSANIFTWEKGRDLTESYDKSPFIHRKIQKGTRQHTNATKNFDYTTIADRLRTVSGSNNSHPTGVVKPVYERSTFPLTATAVYMCPIKRHIRHGINLNRVFFLRRKTTLSRMSTFSFWQPYYPHRIENSESVLTDVNNSPFIYILWGGDDKDFVQWLVKH